MRAMASQPTESAAYRHSCTTNLEAKTAAMVSVASVKANREGLSLRQRCPVPVKPCQITPASGQPTKTETRNTTAPIRLVQIPIRKKPLAEPVW
ncbi:Uncharacterised protein [Mycobacteroides abscessus subsp. massiliense]|nr:Uncharacterised protein [Mycobacteroides abscessus subsp. massiliense]